MHYDPNAYLEDDALRRICERIWRQYKLFASLAFVSRKGFELVGLTPQTEAPVSVPEVFERRGESVLEHSAKVAWLAAVFAANFPEFFGQLHRAVLGLSWEQLLIVALQHDIGETATGDIPDDGRPEHAAKNAAEERVFGDLCSVFMGYEAERMSEFFHQFDDQSTHAGQALKVLDKIEAVLTHLYLEQFEIYGLITAKPVPTASDRHFMRVTGSPSSTDCWCAHALSMADRFSPSIAEPVRMLLDVAVRDVRGEPFAWFREYPIPPWDGA